MHHSMITKHTIYLILFLFIAIECPSGMVYQQCGALCPQVCYGPTICNGGCAEGCFCPDGQVVDDEGQCVERGICGGKIKVCISTNCIFIALEIDKFHT